MEMNEEYHDPDYPEVPVCVKQEAPSVTEDEKIALIKRIVRCEFRKELDARENEVALIDQRMTKARRYLHLLRYTLVNNYYSEQKLQMSSSQIEDEVAAQVEPRARAEVSSVLRDSQRGLHPSVRKLLGKKTVDMAEIFRSRAPRKKTRVDYSAMVHAKNVTIPADTTKTAKDTYRYITISEDTSKTLRPSTEEPVKSEEEAGCSGAVPKKVPRHLEPKVDNVLTLDGVTRNKQKHRYRIIIGNTSKYMPPASRADRSTHKWLLYVRGPPLQPDVSRVITSVTVRLHHSYAPHHIVVIDKPPFQLSRRGWGEFAAKVTLEFVMPNCNRPATLTHTIKLDRNYTGLQTLGAETVVDVWLYSTPEMLPFEYKTDQERIVKPDEQTNLLIKDIKTEPNNEINESSEMSEIREQIDEMGETKQAETDEWLNFFTNDTTEVNVDEMFIKNFKSEKNLDEINQAAVKDAKVNQSVAKDKFNQVMAKDCKINQSLTKEIKTNPTNDYKGNQRIVKGFNESTAKESEFNKSMNNDFKVNIKIEPTEVPIPNGNYDNENNELKAIPNDNPKRIVKYMEPTTRKIYYLEVDRNLDLNKIQEIVINSQGEMKTAKVSPNRPSNGLRFVRKKKGQSLLRPDIKNQLVKKPNDEQNQIVISNGFEHIKNDHCYIANDWFIREEHITEPIIEMTKDYLKDIRSDITRLTCPRVIVSYLLKKIPIISDKVRDVDFSRTFPFVVECHERYWKFDFAKRRNIEWSRAKLINKLLNERFQNNVEKIWRTKQILVFSRLHGYYPVRPETVQRRPENPNLESNDWSSWNDLENSRKSESNIRELYPKSSDLCSLTLFKSDLFLCNQDSSVDLCESDEEIDIVSDTVPVKVTSDAAPECNDSLTALPVNSEDRLRFLFIEKMCADIGIELRNEDVGNGYSYSAVHSALLTAVKCFAEEMIRAGLADQLALANDPLLPSVWIGSSSRSAVRLEHVYRAVQRAPRLRALCSPGAVAQPQPHTL